MQLLIREMEKLSVKEIINRALPRKIITAIFQSFSYMNR